MIYLIYIYIIYIIWCIYIYISHIYIWYIFNSLLEDITLIKRYVVLRPSYYIDISPNRWKSKRSSEKTWIYLSIYLGMTIVISPIKPSELSYESTWLIMGPRPTSTTPHRYDRPTRLGGFRVARTNLVDPKPKISIFNIF